MAIYLTSDNHFSHKNSMRYCGRPFWTAQQCDEEMIRRWNEVVKPEDAVYHLGDVAMHTAPIKRIIPQLNGYKILIIGNHDLIYPYFLKTRGQKFIDKMLKEYKEAGFDEIHSSGYEIVIPMIDSNKPIKARLSHFPTKDTIDKHYNDKHDLSRPIDNGMLNICGHVHTSWKKRGNNINVGVDVFDFKPISLDKVIELWKNGPKNIDNPKPIRTWLWVQYHTLVWKLSNLFKKR